MGHQGRNASHDIFFENALPVIDGPAFAVYIREVLVPEIAPGTVVILPYHRIAAQYPVRQWDRLARPHDHPGDLPLSSKLRFDCRAVYEPDHRLKRRSSSVPLRGSRRLRR